MSWVPFDRDAVLGLLTTESRQKNRELFFRTHLPVSRVLMTENRLGFEGDTFVGEQDILKMLSSSRPLEGNRIFFVVGETGCGKSELCQWLEYHLPDGHVPIHVSRSHSSLQGMLQVLVGHLPASASLRVDVPSGLLLELLQVHLRIQAHQRGNEDLQEVVERLGVHLAELLQWFEEGADPSLWQRHWSEGGEARVIVGWLEAGLRDALGVRALGDVLREVAMHYAALGKRPVLLLEDITTLAFLRDDLMDYLFDLSAAGFDAVIGLTSGFELSQRQEGQVWAQMAYVRERVCARFVMSSGEGETYFLRDEEQLCNMVRGYLSCLPGREGVEAFEGLFPFTPVALQRLYAHLVEGGNLKQTPRNLMDAVVKNLLLLEVPPFVALMHDHAHVRRPSVRFRQDGLTPEEVGLLYWYGEETQGVLRVPEAVARHFGFPEVPEADLYLLPVPPVHPVPVHQLQQKETRELEWEEAFRQLRGWLEKGEVFPKRHLIKLGVSRFLTAVFEARLVQNPHLSSSMADPLHFFRSQDSLPFHLEDSGDVLPPDGWPVIHLTREVPSRVYEEFLSYAFSAVGSIECFSDPAATFEFTRGLVEDFARGMRLQLRKVLGMEVEAFVLGAWSLVQHLSFGLTSQQLADREQLIRYDFPQYLQMQVWNDPLLQVLSRTNAEVLKDRALYQRLFMSLFHTRDDMVDVEGLGRALEHFRLEGWFRQVQLIDLRLVRKAPYRQLYSKKPLWELVRPLVEYARAVGEFTGQDRDRERLRRGVLALESHLNLGEKAPDLIAQIRQWVDLCGWVSVDLPSPPTLDRVTWQETHHNAALAIRYVERVPAIQRGFLRFWNEKVSLVSAVQWNHQVNAQVERLNGLLQAQFQPSDGWDFRQQDVSARFEKVVDRIREGGRQ